MDKLKVVVIPEEDLRLMIEGIVVNEVAKISFKLGDNEEKDPVFITRNETAKILGVSLVTLNEWIKKGIVPALRIGSRVRFDKKDVYNALSKIERSRK